jgi:serine/threonine-protein kinase
VFGLGILLFELTTGTRLFQGTSDFGVLEQIVHHDIPRPSSRRAGYPPAVERIVMRALARSPDERYQTARDLQLELEAYALENRLPISAVARAAEMHALFGKKVEAWRQALQAGRPLDERGGDGRGARARGAHHHPAGGAGLSAFDATEHIRHAAQPRSRAPLAVALGAVLVAGGASALLLRHRRRPRARPRP